MTKFNSRQKRKYRSYGMTIAEAENMLQKVHNTSKCPQPIHCGYMDYSITNEKHISIIKEAQRLGLIGKHAGSKPIKKLRTRVSSMNKAITRYASAFKELQKLKEQNGENN